jgi:hypothetical protein
MWFCKASSIEIVRIFAGAGERVARKKPTVGLVALVGKLEKLRP